MPRVSVNLRRVYREWRKLTGRTSVNGVKLDKIITDILTSRGVEIPASKVERKEAVNAVLSQPCRKTTTRATVEKSGSAEKSERPKRSAKSNKGGDNFYRSWEWKRARYEALRINGHRCQCCGWQPGDTESGHLVVDHIKPRRHYPKLALDVSNLQVLCNDCNMGKGSTYEDDFRWFDRAHRATIQ